MMAKPFDATTNSGCRDRHGSQVRLDNRDR
jgi:hypothetical protein